MNKLPEFFKNFFHTLGIFIGVCVGVPLYMWFAVLYPFIGFPLLLLAIVALTAYEMTFR